MTRVEELAPTADAVPARCAHRTPYYEIIVSTSPARIERLAIDPSGTGRHLGVVNNFGPKGSAPFASYGSRLKWHEDKCFEAGRPERVVADGDELRLEDVPVGPHGLLLTWTFTFRERDFLMRMDWRAGVAQHGLWEAGWKLDTIAAGIGDERGLDLAPGYRGSYRARDRALVAWSEPDPRYEHTLVAALVPGSAERGDDVYLEPSDDRPATWGAWLAVSVPGGLALEAGETFTAGTWRIAGSGRAGDLAFASAIAAGEDPEPAAAEVPASDRDDAVAWGEEHAAVLAAAGSTVVRGRDGSLALTDGELLAAFVPSPDGAFGLRCFVRGGDGWTLALCGGPGKRYTAVAPGADGQCLEVTGEATGPDGALASRTAERWTLESAPGRLHVDSTDTCVGSDHPHPLHTYLAYPGGRTKHELTAGYDAIVGPHLRPRADLIMGQHAMRSPAVGVQHEAAWSALVPDLLVHRQAGNFGPESSPRHFGLVLDLDVGNQLVDAPVLGFGWRTMEWTYSLWRVEEGYFCRDLGLPAPTADVRLAYDLLLDGAAAAQELVSATQRLLWERVGHRYFEQSVLPQTQPADSAFDDAWTWGSGLYDARMVDGRRVGALRVDREFPPDVMFMSWFNALRTSYGIYAQGRDRGDVELQAIGRSTLDLLLSAPTNQGAFPTIASFQPDGIEWYGSHKNFANQMPWGPSSYNTFDMGWAAYWVLRWYQDLEPDPRALEFARAYGDFVVSVQLPSGAVPSWLDMEDLSVNPHLRESAQTAGSLLLLTELAHVTGDDRFAAAAEAAGDYVVREHVRRQRWDDYEVFYSNAPKSEGANDPISGMSAQDTLSMHFAAAGLLGLWRLTGEERWLAEGRRALDQMLQYQAVWPASFLSLYSYGGFSVQNTDQEWNDARQAQIGPTLLDYARATGRADYAERGIVAMRAAYATMCTPKGEPANPRYFDYQPLGWGNENYAHNPYDAPTTPVPSPHYDWSVGAACAAFAEARNRFGDVWVDLANGAAFGVDDVQVTGFERTPGAVSLELTSPSPGHAVVLRAEGADDDELALHVNGRHVGTFSPQELRAGVPVPTRHGGRIVHNPVRATPARDGSDFSVSARLPEGTPLESATLRYRRPDADWQEVPMHAAGGGNLTGAVPAHDVRHGEALEYAIAVDTGTGVLHAPEVDPASVPFRHVVA